MIRGVLLLATGISLYLLLPSLLEVFSSWRRLRELDPLWMGLAALFEVVAFVSIWEVRRIALHTTSWYAVATSQLAANAVGGIIPPGGATAGAAEYRLLVRAGVAPQDVASGLTAAWLLISATMFALPVLALPAVLGSTGVPRKLENAAWIGAAAFVATAGVCASAVGWDRPLLLVARAVRAVAARVGKRDAVGDLPERLLAQRDRVRDAFGARWRFGLAAAVGRWGFDYLALLCVLAALGARPKPELVLLAYVGAALLASIPITPGGLGFVEAGLTGMLVLAGAGAETAVVATLAYRLVQFWLPLPLGLVAAGLHRRRYGSGGADAAAATVAAASVESSATISSPP